MHNADDTAYNEFNLYKFETKVKNVNGNVDIYVDIVTCAADILEAEKIAKEHIFNEFFWRYNQIFDKKVKNMDYITLRKRSSKIFDNHWDGIFNRKEKIIYHKQLEACAEDVTCYDGFNGWMSAIPYGHGEVVCDRDCGVFLTNQQEQIENCEKFVGAKVVDVKQHYNELTIKFDNGYEIYFDTDDCSISKY